MSKGNKFCRSIYKTRLRGKNFLRRIFVEPIIRKSFGECGKNVHIFGRCSFSGIENMHVGNNVIFSSNSKILTTRAKVIVGDYVMLGQNLTLVTGDHRTDILGKYMMEIKDSEKLPENDADVVIEDDVWAGTNVTILKGVTIGRGSIIASGAVVTKSIPPYSIVGGVPAKVLKSRFTEQEIEQHERMLRDRADKK